MKMEIMPSKEQMKIWIEKFVPEKDFFFIDEKGFILNKRDCVRSFHSKQLVLKKQSGRNVG